MADDAHDFFRGMHLVVLGAGYVGTAVVEAGLARGVRVSALTRNPVRAAALHALGAATVVADLATDDWHARLPADAEFVVDCVSSGGGGPDGYQRSYVDGMHSILAWVGAGRAAGTFVYTSSTSVYPQDGGVRVGEDAFTEAASGPARILLAAEALAQAWPGRSMVLRLAGIYGPGRHHVLDQLRSGAAAIGGAGAVHLNLVHRDDIVSAVWAALTAPPDVAGGIFNVADDGAATKEELAVWLSRRIGRKPPEFSGGPAVGRSRVTPDRVIANDRIKQMLGWRPRYPTFREGYAKLLENADLRCHLHGHVRQAARH